MNIDTENLKAEIKKLIVETLNLKDVNPDEIVSDKPLFGGDNSISLDSIDAIELIMAIQRTYSVRLDDQNLARNILFSVDTIADFVVKEKSK
jgi:acyl carrier protein